MKPVGLISAGRLAARKWIECACGCGEQVRELDQYGRKRAYAPYHNPVRYRRKHRQMFMPIAEARQITGGITKTTKMPGWSYSLDAFACKEGYKLSQQPGSTCEGCYAKKGFYMMPATRGAVRRRQRAIFDPRWVEAMAELILFEADDDYFRWHDSGDLQSAEHLAKIVRVCELTPKVRHWLPTREYYIVIEYLRAGGKLPANLCLRLSAHWVGLPAFVAPELAGLPTSTVHLEHRRPVQLRKRNQSIECKAYTREDSCGNCRACWEPRVKNVSYAKH
jgi:hypothetical protein